MVVVPGPKEVPGATPEAEEPGTGTSSPPFAGTTSNLQPPSAPAAGLGCARGPSGTSGCGSRGAARAVGGAEVPAPPFIPHLAAIPGRAEDVGGAGEQPSPRGPGEPGSIESFLTCAESLGWGSVLARVTRGECAGSEGVKRAHDAARATTPASL